MNNLLADWNNMRASHDKHLKKKVNFNAFDINRLLFV